MPAELWEWTDIERRMVIQMYRDGLNVWEMGKELRRDPDHIAIAIIIWAAEGG